VTCVDCGNDNACEGYLVCSGCLETYVDQPPPTAAPAAAAGNPDLNGRSDAPVFDQLDQAFELDMNPNGRSGVRPGERVRVQTMWGHELGQVVDILRGKPSEGAFPMAEVHMENGDTIYVNVARCTRED